MGPKVDYYNADYELPLLEKQSDIFKLGYFSQELLPFKKNEIRKVCIMVSRFFDKSEKIFNLHYTYYIRSSN